MEFTIASYLRPLRLTHIARTMNSSLRDIMAKWTENLRKCCKGGDPPLAGQNPPPLAGSKSPTS